MAFHWRANDGPFIVIFGSSIPSSTKKKQKKTRNQIWTPSDKTFWIRTLGGVFTNSVDLDEVPQKYLFIGYLVYKRLRILPLLSGFFPIYENVFDYFVSKTWFTKSQGSHRNSKTKFHDFSMIFHDQQCNFHDYLMHRLQPALLAASSPT